MIIIPHKLEHQVQLYLVIKQLQYEFKMVFQFQTPNTIPTLGNSGVDKTHYTTCKLW